MKKSVFVFLTLALIFTGAAWSEAPKPPAALISPNILGAAIGVYSGTVEFAIDEKLSFELTPGYFNARAFPIVGTVLVDKNIEFLFGALSVGANYYLNGNFNGPFAGVYAKGTYFLISEGVNAFDTGSAGIGIKAGYRLTWDWFSIAYGAGYEYNKAFAAVNASTVNEAIKNFLFLVEGAVPIGFFTMAIAVK